MAAQVTRSATRWWRRARTWVLVDPHVVTVSVVLPRPAPATRTQTFASFLEMSRPAHRTCTTSITLTPSGPDHCDVRRGEGREIQESDARARGHQSTVPVE